MNCDITFSKPVICEDEKIARLLSSPEFYDKTTKQINFETFNLRTFSNGEKEAYLSLVRLNYTTQKDITKKGKYIFKKGTNEYVGYGTLKTKDLKEERIGNVKIFPVKQGKNEHCGLFYINKNRVFVTGDLTQHPEFFHSIRKLCKILNETLVLK